MHRDERTREEVAAEKYHLVVNEGQKLRNKSTDDGMPLVKGRHKKPKIASNKGALTAGILFDNKEDKNIFSYHYAAFKAEIIERKGELNIADNLLLVELCSSVVRFYRKTKLESTFGRFMDRVATQDPQVQINNCLKSLGLLSDKKDSDDDVGKRLTQILTLNIDDNGETVKKIDGFKSWQDMKDQEKDEVKLTTYSPKERITYGDEFDSTENE